MDKFANDISEKALIYAACILKFLNDLEKTSSGKHISLQLFRSATSVGANYEEARNAESRRDFVHKLQISLKECGESVYWLRLIKVSNIIQNENVETALKHGLELLSILTSSVKTTKSNMLKQH